MTDGRNTVLIPWPLVRSAKNSSCVMESCKFMTWWTTSNWTEELTVKHKRDLHSKPCFPSSLSFESFRAPLELGQTCLLSQVSSATRMYRAGVHLRMGCRHWCSPAMHQHNRNDTSTSTADHYRDTIHEQSKVNDSISQFMGRSAS